MREYKRLTERDEFNNADIIGLSTEKLYSELCFDETNLLTNGLNRLAELEDKIERGELFSIPFMYHSRKLNAYTVVYEDDDCEYLMGQAFRGKNAKEEAEEFLEQKLKELKGEV